MQKLRTEINDLASLLEETFELTSDMIDLYGCELDTALKNQLLLQLEWEIVNKKARKLHSKCELKVDEMYSTAFRNEISNNHKALSTTEAREYAKTNKDYLDARLLLIEATELKEEASGLLEVIISRKYVLNNLTNAIISSANKEVL